MRARFHVHGGRAGFYREGTHQLCEPGPTRQLRPEAIEATAVLARSLDAAASGAVTSISITENVRGDQRAVHLELAPGAAVAESALEQALEAAQVRGISGQDGRTGRPIAIGLPIVSDGLADITGGDVAEGTLQRRAESFFQANRFLLPQLVAAVAAAVPDPGEVLDLYAGVGLFSVALAASGRLEVTAVEGDRSSGADLRENARGHEPRLAVHVARVEDYLASRRGPPPATLILDPPRTGMSKDAAEAVVRLRPPRIVYVSCDPPTLARDARRLLDAGYRLESIRAFDLFPNTPHVETLAVLISD
jgi:23S rRNA (uracil1939-C5)-methyltransferase